MALGNTRLQCQMKLAHAPALTPLPDEGAGAGLGDHGDVWFHGVTVEPTGAHFHYLPGNRREEFLRSVCPASGSTSDHPDTL